MSPSISKPQLWLTLRFPHLPLEVVGHTYNSATPVIISDKRRVYRLNALALAAGVNGNMTLSKAQSLSDAVIFERDPEKEHQSLQQVAEICYQFTPYIEWYNDDSLLLEISRSLTLFQGMENLTRRLSEALTPLSHLFHYGLAHTEKASWLLSWQYHPISNQDKHTDFLQRLQQAPIHLVNDFPNAIATLKKSGFQTLGDIFKQMDSSKSSAAISQRFGTAFSQYVQDILGSEIQSQSQLFTKPPNIFKPTELFQERIQFDYPITNMDQLRDPMQHLLEALIDYLQEKQQQSHSIIWRLYDIHNAKQDLIVSIERIHNQWQLPLDLTMIQLEATALTFEVDSLELLCCATTSVDISNHVLLGQGTSHRHDDDTERLFAKLCARLGKQALKKLTYIDNIFPGQDQQFIAVTGSNLSNLPPQKLNSPRPSWLFNPPLPIQQKQQQLFWHGHLQLLQGPERVQGHWWESPVARDYFMAQRNDYVRCWVYQDLKSRQWYVHGVFG